MGRDEAAVEAGNARVWVGDTAVRVGVAGIETVGELLAELQAARMGRQTSSEISAWVIR